VPYCGRTGKEGDSEPPAKRPRLLANSQPLVRRKCSLIVGGNQREGKKKVDYSILFPPLVRIGFLFKGMLKTIVFSLFVSPRHPKGRPYVPRETRPIQIKIERAPTTKGNGMSTTGWENLIIRGLVTGQVIKLSHFDQHGCKWTGFMGLNWLRPKSWLLQPKKGRPPIQTKRSTSPHLRRSCWSWAPNYESLLFLFLRAVWSNRGSDHSWCFN